MARQPVSAETSASEVRRVVVRRRAYLDSVALMLASRDATSLNGVRTASVLAATPLNLRWLHEQGFDSSQYEDAGVEDIAVAITARTEEAAERALELVDRRLGGGRGSGGSPEAPPPLSLASAARRDPGLSLALVSTRGEHAAFACADALEAGLNVFCFSDGVSLDEEVALKRRAIELGLLMMGPECGTAIIDGVGLGFSNAVRRGPVGIVGASGSGTQALTCHLDAVDVGVSHAVGVGGRDLQPAVEALMSLAAVDLLAGDSLTEALCLVGKAADPTTVERVGMALAATGKPAVIALPGIVRPPAIDGVDVVATLEGAAARLAEHVGAAPPRFAEELSSPPRPGTVHGLYSGGTLCEEAVGLAAASGVSRISRGPTADGELGLDPGRHGFVDFGAASLTRGRAHPMIDPTLRAEALEREAARDGVAALLLDVVLGRAAHPDPAAELVPALERGLARRSSPLSVVVSLCGAVEDPQDLDAQAQSWRRAGAVVTRSNAHAVRLALRAASVEPAR